MTKAKTVAARRAGRKRDDCVARYPGGKKKPRTETDRAMDARRTVCEARCRRFGLRVTDANLRKVADNRFGSVLGILSKAKIITEAMEEAGYKYAKLEADYARAIGFPKRGAAIAAYGEVTGGLSEDADGYVEDIRRRHAEMKADFNRLGTLPRRALNSVVLDEGAEYLTERGLAALRIGLKAMVLHFRVDGAKKVVDAA